MIKILHFHSIHVEEQGSIFLFVKEEAKQTHIMFIQCSSLFQASTDISRFKKNRKTQ